MRAMGRDGVAVDRRFQTRAQALEAEGDDDR
jgi:hypothetical protein